MRTFETILESVAVDPASGKENVAAAALVKLDYLILFGPRTGSTWLTHLLGGNLGNPDEYINPDLLAGNAMRAGVKDRNSFIQAMRGMTQCNGVFGIEATCEHIDIFGKTEFLSCFPNLTVFHLWRENLVAQSVSIYRAVKTGQFHSTDGKPAAAPEYIPSELSNWYQYMSRIENGNVDLINGNRFKPINLTYETIFRDKTATRALFSQSLGLPAFKFSTSSENRIEKLASGWNIDAEKRFRHEFEDLIKEVEAHRKVRLYGMKSALGD